MPFTFQPTQLSGVVIVEPTLFADDRGFFVETYKQSDFVVAGIDVVFVQENQSKSVRGTLRGLHFQRAPKMQAKLVRAIEGEIFDVVVDIRKESPTFGRWEVVLLSAENRRSIYVPAGYAHGFCVTSAEAQVVYKTSAEYAPELEGGVRWNDPALAIPWPIAGPILSRRDEQWPNLAELV
jgi:dTDP-4-dehydrorhamnose 3,5-epimerase